MMVLDASAVLALLHDEPGGQRVLSVLYDAVLSTVNLAEVVGSLSDRSLRSNTLAEDLMSAGVVVEPLSAEDAALAGGLRTIPGGRGLSLADRCCLALTLRTPTAEVLTGDRAWTTLDLPVTVHLLR